MWLLDANMDVHLLAWLREHAVDCDGATRRGWQALGNGELVSAAVDAGFTCLITQDRLFGEAAARALKSHPAFAVVVVRLPQSPWKQYQLDFAAAWEKARIAPVAGRVIHWPSLG